MTMEDEVVVLDETVVRQLEKVIVGSNVAAEDLMRWFSQGFCFSSDEPTYGLTQSHGGPCGVISALQAEIFREVLFGENAEERADVDTLPAISMSRCQELFEVAAWTILLRASTDGTVVLVDAGSKTINSFSDCVAIKARSFKSEDYFRRTLRNIMTCYTESAGSFLYLISLVLTRGLQNIKEDMDDAEMTLIGNFGHCNQELINLLLVGHATSNVFDGSVPLGDNTSAASNDTVMLKGVPERSYVGYLTQLESLRYCQVGSYYKIPLYPIWVIGSTSHFSVLVSGDRQVNEESSEEALLTRVQRAFKSIDTDECGFIMEDRLAEVTSMRKTFQSINGCKQVLTLLHIEEASDAFWLKRLRECVQMEGGGGIILWSSFWEKISMLLTGKSLDEVLTAPVQSNCTEYVADGTRFRSDSDLARQLQEEWNAQEEGKSESEEIPLPMKKVTRHRTDSIAGKDADIFVVYHYNGFSGVSNTNGIPQRKLTRLTLFRRSQENSVGQSIAFSTNSSAFSGNSMSAIEEVLRTRWPGCRLEWLGSEPRLD